MKTLKAFTDFPCILFLHIAYRENNFSKLLIGSSTQFYFKVSCPSNYQKQDGSCNITYILCAVTYKVEEYTNFKLTVA